MEGPRGYHTVSERKKYHYIMKMWNLKNNTKELIYKTEADSQTWKTDLWLPKGKTGRGGIN